MIEELRINTENINNYSEEDIKFIVDNLNNNKVIAIGEIGLDYHYSKEDKEKQIVLFERMLKIAQDNNLPVIIHSREATEDTLKTIKKYKVHGVIHSFSGSLETAKEYMKLGFCFGINGVITFKNANIKDVIKNIPLDRIILETDSPYLTPEPHRGKQNNPSHIMDIATFVAKLYDINLEDLSKITNNNIKRIFGI
jgi:TatD DNase family protein